MGLLAVVALVFIILGLLALQKLSSRTLFDDRAKDQFSPIK
jgi:hypothetical protein